MAYTWPNSHMYFKLDFHLVWTQQNNGAHFTKTSSFVQKLWDDNTYKWAWKSLGPLDGAAFVCTMPWEGNSEGGVCVIIPPSCLHSQREPWNNNANSPKGTYSRKEKG